MAARKSTAKKADAEQEAPEGTEQEAPEQAETVEGGQQTPEAAAAEQGTGDDPQVHGENDDVNDGPVAAPLSAPRKPNPVAVPDNIDEDTLVGADTPAVRPVAATPNFARDNERLVDGDGNDVTVEDIFPSDGSAASTRKAKFRAFVEGPMPGAPNHTTTRVLFGEGAQVSIHEVARLSRRWSKK